MRAGVLLGYPQTTDIAFIIVLVILPWPFVGIFMLTRQAARLELR